MQFEMITKLQNQLDTIEHKTIDEGVAFWYARDLQMPLGYDRWENFMTAIKRAMESCKTTGHSIEDHFRGVTKMIVLGSRAILLCLHHLSILEVRCRNFYLFFLCLYYPFFVLNFEKGHVGRALHQEIVELHSQ